MKHAALLLLALTLRASTINVSESLEFTLETGDTLAVEISTANYTYGIGSLPSIIRWIAKPTVESALVDGIWTDTLYDLSTESLDGTLLYSNVSGGQFSYVREYAHMGDTVLWDYAGAAISIDATHPDVIAHGGAKMLLTNLGAPLRFGNDNHRAIHGFRVGAILIGDNGASSVGAGFARNAYIMRPDVLSSAEPQTDSIDNPEPSTYLMFAGGLLALWGFRRRRK